MCWQLTVSHTKVFNRRNIKKKCKKKNVKRKKHYDQANKFAGKMYLKCFLEKKINQV